MNKQELEEVLLLNKVPKDLYSLSGGLPNESYCLEKEKNRWHVYYSERGIKTSVGYFENEEAACECLLKEIRKIVSIVQLFFYNKYIRTEYCLSKDLERIIFMVFDAVKMMRSFVEKILKGGIPDTKIGIKSGTLFKDFP